MSDLEFLIFEQVIDPILIEDMNGVVVNLNKAAEQIYGWAKNELIGKPIKTIVPPGRHSQADDLLTLCKAGEEVRDVDGLRQTKEGRIVPVLLTLSLLRNETGNPEMIVTIAKDISELKEVEEKLRIMSKVFMDASDPILIEDLDGMVLNMNREAERSYGWSKNDLLGWPIKTIVPTKRHKQADGLLARCKAGEDVRNVEGLRWTREKKIIPVLLTLSLLKNEQEEPVSIATIAKDITAQKQVEEKLRRMSKVFKDAADPILIEDLDGLVVDLNEEAERSYGWTREDLVGRPIKTIVPPERHSQADELLVRCKTGKKVRNIEGLRWTRDKKVIPVLLTLSMLRGEEKRPVGIATIAKDITELKEAEEEISLTQDVTIESMGTLAEYRDPETGGHIKRTRNYVWLLAMHLKDHPKFKDVLDDATIELLYKSAPLHDIGKVGVPDNILLKPGKLTIEEFELMKKHTIYGMEAIAALEEKLGEDSFLHLAWEIAATHQEKWDGSGYPQGVKGEDIPVSGRLMALADVYDALISKRVYKPSMPHSKAVAIISEGRGSHFDPDMVDAFMELEDEFRKIALEHADFDEERENLK